MPAFPWSLRQLSTLVRKHEVSPLQAVRATASAIERTEPLVQAWCQLNLDAALQRAAELTEQLEHSAPCSALYGVPYGVKDIFDTAGLPTEWGSRTQRGRVPGRDCELVAALHTRGCILAGKTHTTALAYYDTGPTRNPHAADHTPGGSSSGSAAAVAAGMVPLAIGSQTQGSVLRPASFCGVVGFKPSFGGLPLAGVMRFAPTLDQVGLFTASASDMEFAWQVLGPKPTAVEPAWISVIDWPPRGRLDSEMALCLQSAVQVLAGGGQPIRRVPRPGFLDAVPAALHAVMAYEAAREHGALYRVHGAALGDKLSALLDEGLRIEPDAYAQARQRLRTARTAYRRWARSHPVVATAAALGPAPQGLESSGDPRCNAPFTALGLPAISVPMPTGSRQLPMGLQLVSAPGRDGLVLDTAASCERLFRDQAGRPPR